MFYKYIVSKDNDMRAVRFGKWDSQLGSTNSIVSTNGRKHFFAVKNINSNCDINLSLFCEYVSRNGVHKRGNFYIKIIDWNTIHAIEDFIIDLSNNFNLSTKRICVYKVNCKSSVYDEEYIILEIPELEVRRSRAYTDGFHLPKIYKEMTESIDEFCRHTFSKESVKIDYLLYDNGLCSCVTYCYADIKPIEINKSCRIDTGSKKFELLEFSVYRLIYGAITDSEDMAIRIFSLSCRLFDNKLRGVKFGDTLSNDLFLYNFIVSILNLKGVEPDELFYIQSLARELINPQIKDILKKGITATCSGLGCQFREIKCNYSSINNHFHLFHTRNGLCQLSTDFPTCRALSNSKLKSIRLALSKFIDHKDTIYRESILILLIFTCIAVSKCRFSVHYNHRVYNNSLPLIVNFGRRSSMKHCMKLISLLEKSNDGVIKNVKATNLSKYIKKNACLTIIDTMENGRFSVLQMANTYTPLSESCFKAIKKFGCFDTDTSARINTLIVSENNKIDDFFEKRPRSLRNKLQEFIIIDHYGDEDSIKINTDIIEAFIFSIDKSLTTNKISIELKDIDSKYGIFRAVNEIYDDHGLAGLYDLKFKINTLAMAIMFSCFFSFFENKKDNISFEKEEFDISCYILNIILSEIKQSLRKYGNLSLVFYEKILKLVLAGKSYPVYISKRQILRAIGVTSNNKYVERAIEELILNEKIVQIDICLKKRKGRPCGPIYYVPENDIGNKGKLALTPEILKECARRW